MNVNEISTDMASEHWSWSEKVPAQRDRIAEILTKCPVIVQTPNPNPFLKASEPVLE